MLPLSINVFVSKPKCFTSINLKDKNEIELVDTTKLITNLNDKISKQTTELTTQPSIFERFLQWLGFR